MSLNNCFFYGRFGADPEERVTASGSKFCTFSLAVDRDFKNASGNRVTDWFDFIAWGKTAEFVAKYFAKGDSAIVVSQAQTKKWTDKDEKTHTNTEFYVDKVYFGGNKKTASGYKENDPVADAIMDKIEKMNALTTMDRSNNGYEYLEGEDDQLPF